jgi:integrase
VIRKNKSGNFTVDISMGRNKRHRKNFKTRQEAQAYERHFLAKLENGKEWQPKRKDRRTLSELVQIWDNLHGFSLVDGVRLRGKLLLISKRLGDCVAQDLNANDWIKYRAKRIKEVSARTVNNEHGFLNSMFNKLYEIGEVDYKSKINDIKKIKIKEKRLRFLSTEEINKLLNNIEHKDTLIGVKIALSTGCRWGELRNATINNNKITFTNTKNGKNRTVPIKNELAREIQLPITPNEKILRKAFKTAGIEMEKGQNTHILRHTFASHFIMNGGNILTLQKILDHAGLKTVLIYAHLSKDHLQEAVKFSPI